jgi:hypothetical protein
MDDEKIAAILYYYVTKDRCAKRSKLYSVGAVLIFILVVATDILFHYTLISIFLTLIGIVFIVLAIYNTNKLLKNKKPCFL